MSPPLSRLDAVDAFAKWHRASSGARVALVLGSGRPDPDDVALQMAEQALRLIERARLLVISHMPSWPLARLELPENVAQVQIRTPFKGFAGSAHVAALLTAERVDRDVFRAVTPSLVDTCGIVIVSATLPLPHASWVTELGNAILDHRLDGRIFELE